MPCKQPWPAEKIDPRFADTVFFVEANSFEQLKLWETNAAGNWWPKLPWEEDCKGFMETIGYLSNRPVCVSFSFAKINGRRICFFDPTSQVVDHKMIEKWFEENCFPVHRGNLFAQCDAMNFHHCLEVCRASVTNEKVEV
jgi:hypothetical protein